MADPTSITGLSSRSDDSVIRKALVGQRIIWMAMIMGQLSFLFVIVFAVWPSGFNGDPKLAQLVFPVAVGYSAIAICVGWLLRRLIFKRSPDGTVQLRRFVTGNIILWSCCESAGLFGLVTMMLSKKLWPPVIIPAIALSAHILTLPFAANVRQNADTE